MAQKKPPLIAVYKQFLTDITDELTETLGLQGQLLNKLLAKGAIGSKQYKRIKAAARNGIDMDVAEKLLESLEKRTAKDYEKFFYLLGNDEDETGAAELVKTRLKDIVSAEEHKRIFETDPFGDKVPIVAGSRPSRSVVKKMTTSDTPSDSKGSPERQGDSSPCTSESSSSENTDSPIVNVTNCSKQFYEDHKRDAYKMDHDPRGIAVIVNVKQVKDGKPRRGTNIDCKKLHQLWKELGFKVIVYNDKDVLTKEDLLEKMKRVAQSIEEEKKAQCLVVCLLSHGKKNRIFCPDGLLVRIKEDLMEYFTDDKCSVLKNKPRLWFVQACRRDKTTDQGVQTTDDSDDSEEEDDDECTLSDVFMACATSEGFKARRNPQTGSRFIKALVKVFSENACKDDLSCMMQKVNAEVTRRQKELAEKRYENVSTIQAPEFTNRLHQNLYFFPGIGLRKEPQATTSSGIGLKKKPQAATSSCQTVRSPKRSLQEPSPSKSTPKAKRSRPM